MFHSKQFRLKDFNFIISIGEWNVKLNDHMFKILETYVFI